MTDERWYILWVMTGQEQDVMQAAQLLGGIEEALVPRTTLQLRKGGAWHETTVLLFPSYVFLRCKMRSDVYYQLRQTSGVIGWLGMDAYFPTSVPPDEMEHVLALCRGDPPEQVLENVALSKRQRRGEGTLQLMGKQRVIRFGYHMQPDAGLVDPSEAQAEGEQTETPTAEETTPDGEAIAKAD